MKKHWLAITLGAVALAPGCISSDSCVAEGAQVATPLGLRAIESLRVGDEIWAVDPRTGERAATQIVAIRSATRECLALELPDGTSLVCTPDHPVYVAEQGTFLPAVRFMEGKAAEVLHVDERGVRAVRVRAVRADAGLHRVFDLTVESELHDFVANGVLVHNKSPPDPCYEPNPPEFCNEGSSGPPPSTAEGESTDDASTGADSTDGTTATDGSTGTGSTGGTATDDGTTAASSGSDGPSTGSSSSGA